MTTRAHQPDDSPIHQNLVDEMLDVLQRRWDTDVSPPALGREEFDVAGALEIALNEMLDYAREKGLVVRTIHGDEQVTDLIVG
jgi:hypothetical protein